MTKHTPGPWRIGDAGRTVYGPKTNNFPAIVATSPQSFDAIGSEQRKANVRLIAAAPELLEALENLTEWGRTYTSPLDTNSPHELLIAAVNAIAKAKGETT